MSDHSEQLEFMEIDLSEATETASVRIPDRSSLVNQSRQPHRQQGAVLSSEKRFVEEARRLAEVTGEETAPVPFMSYWPTYGVMNDAQLNWYLYWRTEVRQGRYLDVDLSYLFVHVYELINGIGWLTPEDGYEQLKRLLLHYRAGVPQLEFYMQDWLVDYILVHNLHSLMQEVILFSIEYFSSELLDRELHRVLQDNVADIKLDMLQRYYDYDVTLNTFYRDGGKEMMERYVPKVMAVVDSYLKRTQPTGLLPELEPEAERTVKRTLFQKAVYDESIYGRFVTFTYFPVGYRQDFTQRLTRIYRCTENKLREWSGFRGRLRGKTLEPELAAVIERYLDRALAMEQAEAVTAPVIQIDTAKLASLQEDSEYVRKALTIEENEAPASVDVELQSPEVPDEAESLHPRQMTHAESRLSEQREHSPVIQDNTVMPSENATPRNELLLWDETAEADVPEEWLEFAERLESRHVRAIHALLGDDPDHNVMRLAEELGTMPALLLDEMNDVAMETIGDLLVDSDRIVPDYIELFEHVKR
ncbi:TerB N-terminal domain-containing protein [Paenibacillus sp. TSA_86.1]|uniref:TerB N-terminal domain-containing protein n=1 Tax=Paenibacillus sp. TSA_86.1 TaxID=3415649 RepID=UPI00404622E7